MSELALHKGILPPGYEHFKAPRYLESLQNRYRRPVEAEKQIPSLAEEINAIKQNGQQDMYLLPGTGFQVKTQVDLLLENYKNDVPLSDSLQQLEQDIQGFKVEYLAEQPVFPILLEKTFYNGRERLTGALYSGRPYADAISADEREGVVKASTGKIEEALLAAEAGTMVIMTSPKGWSGYQTKDQKLEKLNPFDVAHGKAQEIEYPDTQTYCYQVQKDGSVKGFTLKTDMTLAQNKALLETLGTDVSQFTDKNGGRTEIKQVMESVLIINPKNAKSIEYIAKTIQHINRSDVAYRDSSGTPRYFSEMIALLRNPESLWTLDGVMKSMVNPLKEYVSNRMTSIDMQLRTDLETAIGLTVLKLMDKIRPSVPQQEMIEGKLHNVNNLPLPILFNPVQTLERLKQIGGCAGGRNKNKTIIDSLSPRLGLPSLIDNNQEWFNCPKCDYKADGPIGNTCPGCNLTKEEYIQEEGIVVCD